MKKCRMPFLWICMSLSIAIPGIAQHDHGAAESTNVGKVEFQVSCDPEVRRDFNRAVALLHSFWYQNAADLFAAIAKSDPSCGMAYWGVAMTHYHQLWETPTDADLIAGAAAVDKAKTAGAKTDRERGYIAAVEAFYKNFAGVPHHTRALAFEGALEQLTSRNPKDQEAAIFYALAVRANAPPADKTLANQQKASAILTKIFAEQPNHPGLAHYIIHCDDYPELAQQGLDAARRYAKIAPASPHALHMPSHIFTRLGLWQESIESNLASEAAARKEHSAGDELHARDYLVYAYLQRGEDRKAKKVFEALPPLRTDDPAYFAGLYSIGTMAARYALERRSWAEAAALAVPAGVFPGGRYAWTEANIHFARVLGAARMGDADAALRAVQQLTALHQTLVNGQDMYWAEQVDIQREIGSAWIAFAEGNKDDALRRMRAAADHEDATDKHPVTPGVALPARELLGDMLLELNQPVPALEAFEASLRIAPERLHALYGAARAAQLAGNREKARTYYSKLLTNCAAPDADRVEIREAKAFLDRK
jgi:tetratricopeptide (TPR) repeat protein